MKTTGIWLVLFAIMLLILPVSADQTPPVAAFASNITTGQAPMTVQFIDVSSNGPSSWTWTFGDGGTSSLQNPVHTYLTQGTYTVSLTVTNAAGSNTDTVSNYITANKPVPPVASFTANITYGTVPFTVNFTDTSSNSPSAWAWSFGDGGWNTSQNPSHTYTIPGTYTVLLTVTNYGGSNTYSAQNFITANKALAPVVSFGANTTSGTVPLAVSFTDLSSNSPTAWAWSFGDGGTSTLQNPVHTYTTPGTYTVSLTATNYGGSASTVSSGYVGVTAQPPPVAAFTSNITSGSAPLSVTFNDTSINSPTAWAWSFGDGGTSALQNPVYTYTTPGTFTVSLTATNYGGNQSVTKYNYTTVNPARPVASFTSDLTSGPTPFTVSFSDTSSNNPTAWTWAFGDGTTSPRQNPSHTYSVPGKYSVSLIAVNGGGSDSVTKTGYITAVAPSAQQTTTTVSPTSTVVSTTTTAPAPTTSQNSPASPAPDLSSWALPALIIIVILFIGAGILHLLRKKPEQRGRHRGGDL